MKLYHWNNVLNQWHSGDILVLANSLEEARELAIAKLDQGDMQPENEPNEDQLHVMTTLPLIHYAPVAIAFIGSA